jgi:predicted RNA-binding protein with TRAM domain
VFGFAISLKILLMEIPDQLQTLFSATVKEQDNSHVVEIPEQEVELGDVQQGGKYRVALLSLSSTNRSDDTDAGSQPEQSRQTPPVEEGEQRTVEIEGLGDQGDGVARVERGFVVIIPDTEQGERVTVEITDVSETVAFAEVVKRVSYYD